MRFEEGWFERSMKERVEAARERLEALENYAKVEGSKHQLRKEQVGVFSDFVEYLGGAVDEILPFGRIILPPRTGKTVIAGQIICAAQLTTVFLVPTRTLVEQTARELEDQLPGTLIAVYYGDTKEMTGHGVIVMTYQIFLRMWQTNTLPEEVKRSALVIADEAHHAMSTERMKALEDAFDPHAVRLGLTASPDYEEHRRLAHFFPELVHEISIQEALTLGLLAKMRAHVHEVDVDASEVKVVAGDFADEELGRLMSGGPFFELVRKIRYDDPDNRGRGCLIACKSRQQAYDLYKYLLTHKPADASEPVLILTDTTGGKRRDAIAAFETGEINTMVQVGVLLEGWNAPRCKLLIDLAPTISLVRATQKFFRPLTKMGDAEAQINLLLPRNLKQRPILPQELIFQGGDGDSMYLPFKPGERTRTQANDIHGLKRRRISPIKEVAVQSQVIMTVSLEGPLLTGKDSDEVRAVLASSKEFDPSDPPTFHGFRSMVFDHRLFRGRGAHLLRVLKVPLTAATYKGWMFSLYPDLVPDNYLRDHHERAGTVSCYEDARVLLQISGRLPQRLVRNSGVEYGWRTLFGPDVFDEPSPYETVETRRDLECLRVALEEVLDERERAFIKAHFGFNEDLTELTLKQVGDTVGASQVSRERVRQIISRGLTKLSKALGLGKNSYNVK